MQVCYKTNNTFSFKLEEWEMKTPAGKNLLNSIKEEIPSKARSYFPEKKEWLIHHSQKVRLFDLIAEFFFKVTESRQEDIIGL